MYKANKCRSRAIQYGMYRIYAHRERRRGTREPLPCDDILPSYLYKQFELIVLLDFGFCGAHVLVKAIEASCAEYEEGD